MPVAVYTFAHQQLILILTLILILILILILTAYPKRIRQFLLCVGRINVAVPEKGNKTA